MIAILDYGSGNLRSALRAFESTGHEVKLTRDPDIAIGAAGLVVPGVGAFGTCMDGLNSVGGVEIIKARIDKSRPILGICVGMQVLFENGQELGDFAGVGALSGTVSRLSAPILPHMGWNNVRIEGNSNLFKGIDKERFYFVHSYGVKSTKGSDAIAFTDYHGEFVAAVELGAISATQFHPEKSGAAGLRLIRNWSETL